MANRLADLWRRVVRSFQGVTAEEFVGMRTSARTSYVVSNDTALRTSAVWAALRLRANLISTFPLDVYRKVAGQRIESVRPQVLVEPGGPLWRWIDWCYATQFDLDRAGNCFGLITEKYNNGLPRRIDLVALDAVTVVQQASGQIIYRIGNTEYGPDEVWHERQYPIAGSPVGLSPVAYAAAILSENMSIQDFAANWFGRKGIPAATLKNTQQTVDPTSAQEIKGRFMASISTGDPFVSGMDWEYSPIQAEQMGMEWLEDRKFSVTEIARFFDVPADLIDAAVSGQSVTYANITERNLQFLTMNLAPAIARREDNLSRLLGRDRYVKLNTDALLRMDPLNRAKSIRLQIDAKVLTNDEARALEDRQPLTPEEIAQFDVLYSQPNQLALTGGPAGEA